MAKNHIAKLLGAVSLFLVAGTASADSSDFTPTAVGCFDSGTCFIAVSPSVGNISNCSQKDQVRFSLSSAGGEQMYKTALAAYLSGKRLNINVGNTGNCLDNYPRAWYLMIKN